MDTDSTRLRVLRLGHSYNLPVTETDWSKSILGNMQGWCVSIEIGGRTTVSAMLSRDNGREYVEFMWDQMVFPTGYTYDDFESFVMRTARVAGHTRRILELVQ